MVKKKVKVKKKKEYDSLDTEFYQNAPVSQFGSFLELSDLGNAWRFVESGCSLLYDKTKGKWLNWDGCRWNIKTGDTIAQQQAEKIAKGITDEAKEHQNPLSKKKFYTWALISQRTSSIDNILKLAQRIKCFVTYTSDYDKDPWLLNCLNGTIDLRTGKLQEHNHEDKITKLCPVEYPTHWDSAWIKQEEELSLWYEFLENITDGDKQFEKYLQLAAGYSLTGDTSLEIFFMLLSSKARTGKSTFIDALTSVMGNYAVVCSFETFLKHKHSGGGHRADVARLQGARLVAAVEMDRGKSLSEGLIKSATGGDKTAAAYKYGDWFEYKPQYKLWLAANQTPRVSDTDEAMWERIKRLPFEHFFTKKKRNPKVKKELSNPKVAGPTILYWMVQGCLEWQKNPRRLKEPRAIRQATQTYRNEMNPLKTFFEDCCVFSDSSWSPRAEPYDEYKEYCRKSGIKYPLKQREFNERLEGENCRKDRKYVLNKQIKVWLGVKIQK